MATVKRIVKAPIQVFRGGEFVELKPSPEPQDLTTEEVTSINAVNPDAIDVVILEEAPKADAKKVPTA